MRGCPLPSHGDLWSFTGAHRRSDSTNHGPSAALVNRRVDVRHVDLLGDVVDERVVVMSACAAPERPRALAASPPAMIVAKPNFCIFFMMFIPSSGTCSDRGLLAAIRTLIRFGVSFAPV